MFKKIALLMAILIFVLSGCAVAETVTTQEPTTQEPTTEIATNVSGLPMMEGIEGSTVCDITFNFSQNKLWNIPRGGINRSSDIALTYYYCSSTARIDKYNVKISYNISCDIDTEIIFATFEIMNDGCDEDIFTELAVGFLSHCARLPYDKSKPETAAEWVESSIRNNLQNTDEEPVWGDAQFSIGHSTSAIDDRITTIWLNINKYEVI